MKELFLGLCRASIISSIAVLAAVLLRPLLKKGPSFLRCVIWAVVFARLVIPVGLIELPVSVSPFPSPAEETVSQSVSDAVSNAVPDFVPGAVSTPNTDVPNVIPGTVSDTVIPNVVLNPEPTLDTDVPQSVPSTVSTAEPTVDVVEILSVVWVCGTVVMLGYLVASALLLHYRVRDAVVFDSRVRVLGQNCSPFVSGFFRPLIYIPASANRADWQYYIAHEESHIKRFDHILKPLAFLVLCVYWFNPLVWVAYLLLSKDIEYACDEKTVKNMEETDRKAYSLALLSISQGGSVAFTPPLSFGKVSVKERIQRIMNGKIPVWAVCLTAVLCVAILTLMACSVGSAPSGETSEEISSEVSDETSEETSEETSSEVSNETSGETSGGTSGSGIEETYKNASALHEQDPETYRDPGELQRETREMVRLEDGQWYQSYVASDVNIRYVFLSSAEYEMNANWDFIPVGSAKNYFLLNAGVRYEDETGVARYVERPIAVRGTLADGSNGYDYTLTLPDELTVCVAGENGVCDFCEAETLAVSLPGGMTGEKVLTGVVSRDENGVLYLKDASVYASVGPASPSEGQAVTMGAFVQEPGFLQLQQTIYRFLSACIRADRADALLFARSADALPAQFPSADSPDRLTAYAYTAIRFEPYTPDGADTQKADLTVRYALQNANQGVSASLSVVRTNSDDADWQVLSCELTPVPAESATELTFADGTAGTPLTLGTFCGTERYVCLQNTAFRFYNAYLNGDRASALTVADEDALMGAFNEPTRSLNEQGLTLCGFGSDDPSSAYAEYYFSNTDAQFFRFHMRFVCTDSETDAGRKTWRVTGFDFEG